jgi:hypothetical protein
MRTRVRQLLATLTVLFLVACSDPVSKLVNKAFPPIDRTEAALESLEKSQTAISKIKEWNLSAFLEPKDVNTAVKAEIAKLDGVSRATESFGPQRVIVSADVDKTFDDVSARIQGRIRGNVLVSADASSLRLQPILDEIALSHVETKRKDLGLLVPALNGAIRKYLENLNGQIKAISIPISLTESVNWNPEASLKEIPGATQVSANSLNLRIELSGLALLIDGNGVRAIGEAIATTGGPTAAEIGEICASPPPSDPQFSCPLEPGFFGPILKVQCESQKAIALLQAKASRDQRDKLCANVVSGLPAPRIEPRTEVAFNAQFATYHDGFMAKQQSLLNDKAVLNETHVAVLKTFIGSVVNTVLADPAVHIVADMAPPPVTAHPDVNLDTAPNLTCHESAPKCDIAQDCSLDSCNWNCGGWGPGRLGCEINKSACQAAAPAKKAGCETDKSRRKLQCEAEKSLLIAGCEVNQTWLNQWSGMKVGHIDISADIKGKLDLLLKRIQVKTDLSSASANLAAVGVANVEADIHFVPANVGNLACTAPWSGHIRASALYQNQDLSLTGKVALVDATPSDPARVNISTDQTTLALQVAPPPLVALLTQNPQVAIACAPAVAVEGVRATLSAAFGNAQPPELSGQYNYTAGPFSQSLDIKPIDVSVPTTDKTPDLVFRLTPKWSGSVVAFVLSK